VVPNLSRVAVLWNPPQQFPLSLQAQ